MENVRRFVQRIRHSNSPPEKVTLRGPSYQYPPLPKGRIRILCLQSGPRGSPLNGSIIARKPEQGRYIALSYVWGTGEKNEAISIDGKRLPITGSLEIALQYLRDDKSEVRIWIDQICINQKSIADRNEQVARMGHIYSEAKSVTAWLGGGDALTRCFFQALSQVDDIAGRDPHFLYPYEEEPEHPIYVSMQANMSSTWRSYSDSLTLKCDFAEFLQWCADTVVSSSWFSRTWTVQEAVLCPDLLLHAGECSVTWRLFAGFIDIFSDRLGYDASLSSGMLHLTRLWVADRTKLLDFSAILYQFQEERFATNPRDKVYGFLGIMDRMWRSSDDQSGQSTKSLDFEHPDMLQIDYARSTEEVYMDCTHWCVGKTETTDILTGCCLMSIPESDITYILPSWAPDWSSSQRNDCSAFLDFLPFTDEGAIYTTAQNTKARARRTVCKHLPTSHKQESIEWNALQLRGIFFDVVEATTRFRSREDALNPESKTWTAWKQSLMLQTRLPDLDPYPDRQNRIEALWRTLIIDKLPGMERAGPEPGQNFEALMFGTGTPQNPSRDEATFADWAEKYSYFNWHRRLFRTQRGHLGMSCKHIEPGDKVAILWGGRLPFILREMGTVVLDSKSDAAPDIRMSYALIGGQC